MCWQVPRSELQLVGVTALLLAAKAHEHFPPSAANLSFVCDYCFSTDDIARCERDVVQAIGFTRLEVPTALSELDFMLEQCCEESRFGPPPPSRGGAGKAKASQAKQAEQGEDMQLVAQLAR